MNKEIGCNECENKMNKVRKKAKEMGYTHECPKCFDMELPPLVRKRILENRCPQCGK